MELGKILASFPHDWLRFFGYLSVTDDPHGSGEVWLSNQRESLYRSVRHLDLDGLAASLAEEEVTILNGELLFRPRILCLPNRLQESILLFLARNTHRLSAGSRLLLSSALDVPEKYGACLDMRVAPLWHVLVLRLRSHVDSASSRQYYKFSDQSTMLVEDFSAAAKQSFLLSAAHEDDPLQYTNDAAVEASVSERPQLVQKLDVLSGSPDATVPMALGSLRSPPEYVVLVCGYVSEHRFAEATDLITEAFFTCPSEDLKIILEKSSFALVPKEELWALWTSVCRNSAAVSHANSILLCRELVGAELGNLTSYAHRDMAAALAMVLLTFPEVAVKEAVTPVALSSSFCTEQCECILRVLKGHESSALAADLLECICNAGTTWTDACIALIDGLVKNVTTVSSRTLMSLVKVLKMNAAVRVSDLKYGKLVLDVTSRFLTQMEKSLMDDIRAIAVCHQTFVAKAIIGLLAKIT